MKYGIKRTKAFDKDIKLARKRGKDLSKLNIVVDILGQDNDYLKDTMSTH